MVLAHSLALPAAGWTPGRALAPATAAGTSCSGIGSGVIAGATCAGSDSGSVIGAATAGLGSDTVGAVCAGRGSDTVTGSAGVTAGQRLALPPWALLRVQLPALALPARTPALASSRRCGFRCRLASLQIAQNGIDRDEEPPVELLVIDGLFRDLHQRIGTLTDG